VTALFKRIFDTQTSARKNLERTKIRFKWYYDYKANLQVFKENDYVYLLKKRSEGKFNEQYKKTSLDFRNFKK